MSETPKNPSPADLDRMSEAELVELGTRLDGVEIRHRESRWPEGVTTRAEKRAARTVTTWFALSALFALAFAVVYIFWPWEYRGEGEDGYWLYMAYTPLLGGTIGLSILFLGFGAVQFTKKFVPEEISVQTRHDGPSDEVDRRTIVAELNDSWKTSTLGRRKVMGGFLGASVGLIGLSAILPLGGMIKNPWKRGEMTLSGDGTLHTTGWTLASENRPDGLPPEKVYLGRDTGKVYPDGHPPAGEGRLERIRVDDLAAGGLESVFPLPASALGNFEEHMHSIHGSRNSVMLIRFRPEDAARVVKRKGQETSTTATCTPTRRSAPTSAAPPRCTSSRPIDSSARAISRSSTRSSTRSRSSAPPPARFRSCPSPWTARVTSSPTVTSSSRSDPPSGSVVHEH